MTLATKALIKQCCADEYALIDSLTSKLKEIENERKQLDTK
jgi:hypothetical protein